MNSAHIVIYNQMVVSIMCKLRILIYSATTIAMPMLSVVSLLCLLPLFYELISRRRNRNKLKHNEISEACDV